MQPYIRYIGLIVCSLIIQQVIAQPCVKLGQTPPLAIPVCGTTDFVQDSVAICSGTVVPVPPCNNGTVILIRILSGISSTVSLPAH